MFMTSDNELETGILIIPSFHSIDPFGQRQPLLNYVPLQKYNSRRTIGQNLALNLIQPRTFFEEETR